MPARHFQIIGVLVVAALVAADTQREANAAGTIYGFAHGIPGPTQSTWKRDSKNYASLVINQDWPLIQNSSLGSWWLPCRVRLRLQLSVGTCGRLSWAMWDAGAAGPDVDRSLGAGDTSSCRSVGCLRRCGVTRAARCALCQ